MAQKITKQELESLISVITNIQKHLDEYLVTSEKQIAYLEKRILTIEQVTSHLS